MSENESISSSKKLYPRDFLLRYSSIIKPDLTIAEKLEPFLNTSPLGSASCNIPKRTTKNSLDMNAQTSRKNTSNPVYYQKENTLNLSHPVLSKPAIEAAMTTPTSVKKDPLTFNRNSRPHGLNKPPYSYARKTWVAAVESNGVPASNPGSQDVEDQYPDSILTPTFHAYMTPFSSPNLKTPISKSLHESSAPSTASTQSEAYFLSPKSQNATPYKSPASPLGRFASSKSPRSPIRPISPLDEQRLAQRQKQIDYGYRTVGYLRYRLLVPKDHRKPDHPRTPKKTQSCSKRSWDGQLKKWRRDLHLWDPDNVDAFKALLNSDLVVSIIAANPELAEIVDIVKEKLDNPTPDFDDFGDDSDDYLPPLKQRSVPSFPTDIIGPRSTTNNNSEKISPRIGDDSPKVQKNVARTLVF